MRFPPLFRVAVFGLLSILLPETSQAHVTSGGNCAACHSPTTGVATLTSGSLLSVTPRLDGGSTAALPCFTASPGGTVTISLGNHPRGTTGDSFAFAVTGNVVSGSTRSLANVTGVKSAATNVLSYTLAAGWTTRSNGGTYYTQGPLAWTSSASRDFVLTVGTATPPDVYSMTYRAAGLDSSGHWTESKEFLLKVVVPTPVVSTQEATGVTATTAVLHATVNPNGQEASALFQYGTTTLFEHSTGLLALGSGTTNITLTGSLSGLSPATLYHIRAAVVSASGTTYGTDKPFVTPRTYPPMTLAATGDNAHGTPSLRLGLFGTPGINDGNPLDTDDPIHWAYQATLTGSNGAATTSSGIWLGTGTGSALLALSGSAAPGGSTFTAFGDPLLNNNDKAAWVATLGTGAKGIFSNAFGSLALVARTGSPVDSSGVVPSSFERIFLPDQGGVFFVANLTSGIAGVGSKNNQGLWVETVGGPQLLLRKGSSLNGKTLTSFALFGATPKASAAAGQSRGANKQAQLGALGTFTGGSQSLLSLSSGTTFTETVLGGSPAPTTLGASAKFQTFGSPILNEASHLAFRAQVIGVTGRTGAASAIVAQTGSAGTLRVVALSGSFAPDAAGVTTSNSLFASLGDPVFNASDDVAFTAKRQILPGVSKTNAKGVWATASGTLKRVALASEQAPDCPSGVTFKSFLQIALPDQGGAVVLAKVAGSAGGVSAANDIGLWAVDTGGNLRLLVREGDPVDVDGEIKVVSAIAVLTGTPEALGQTRSFNGTGDLVYRLTFTDGTQAIQAVVFP